MSLVPHSHGSAPSGKGVITLTIPDGIELDA